MTEMQAQMSHAIEVLNNLTQRITKVERYLNLEKTNNRQNNDELD
ncbi:3982_t:CDS:1, partial [Dentiscutata erythropus]